MVDNIKDIKDKFSGFTPYINGYQNMKRASVLIPIIKRNNSYEILFEVRSQMKLLFLVAKLKKEKTHKLLV